MTTRFEWSDEQRASVIPGATVVVRSPMLQGRREIIDVRESFVVVSDGGFGAVLPWHYADPESLNLPPDPRQLGLFGGAK